MKLYHVKYTCLTDEKQPLIYQGRIILPDISGLHKIYTDIRLRRSFSSAAESETLPVGLSETKLQKGSQKISERFTA